MLVTNRMLGLSDSIDRALELFASSKEACLDYLRELSDSDIRELEGALIQQGILHNVDFIAWYLEQNIASLPFINTMALAYSVYTKIARREK